MRNHLTATFTRLGSLALMTLALVACSSAEAGDVDASPPPDADLTLTAQNISFDTDELRLTAGEETVVFFVNRDQEQHNLAIYPDAESDEPLFRGDLIGQGTIEFRIPALEPGTYHFQCDPHAPMMNGTVVVEEGAS
jgi:plastocyanin